MKPGFELGSDVEYGCVGSATFEILKKNADEYGGDVNDDGDDKDEHPANIHRNFDYPVSVFLIVSFLFLKMIL